MFILISLTVEKSKLLSIYKNKKGGAGCMFKSPYKYKASSQKNSCNENNLWNEVLTQFHNLPEERQDEIMLRIYKRVYAQSQHQNKHYSVLLHAKV